MNTNKHHNNSLRQPAAAITRSMKVNILIQVYISHIQLQSSSLYSDMVYIIQSAVRITRAIFEIAKEYQWSTTALLALSIAKMIENRQWNIQSPLRQFATHFNQLFIKKLEMKQLSLQQLLLLQPLELAQIIPQQATYQYLGTHQLTNNQFSYKLYQQLHKLPAVQLLNYQNTKY